MRERQDIFDHITSKNIEGVVLLSGDRHFTAGYQVQNRHLEFTSGPLGSGNATLQPNSERFTGRRLVNTCTSFALRTRASY